MLGRVWTGSGWRLVQHTQSTCHLALDVGAWGAVPWWPWSLVGDYVDPGQKRGSRRGIQDWQGPGDGAGLGKGCYQPTMQMEKVSVGLDGV